MQQLVIATTNSNKIERLKLLLADYKNYEIIGLDSLGIEVEEPEETAKTCVGIAVQKALAYVEQLPPETLILTQDDTIKLAGIQPDEDPGTSIKGPVIARYGSFTDEKALQYYTELAEKYGGRIPMTFHYGHAIAYKTKGPRPQTVIMSSPSKLEASLVNKVDGKENVPGYFLAAIMQVEANNKLKHFSLMTQEEKLQADNDLKQSIQGLLTQIEFAMVQ